uniref:C3H1-type domain-containing protein n=1 Tax=Clastoptera arizonana TaxID=38151 RepID=A0A1B6CQA6_9HEMI
MNPPDHIKDVSGLHNPENNLTDNVLSVDRPLHCPQSKDEEKEDRNSSLRSRPSRHRDSTFSPLRRSRSRSWERSTLRRSRSRERERDRSRAWRNKSPPRRYDRERRRSWSKSPRRSHSRSPPSKSRRYRNHSPALRSRSRSPLDKNDKLSPLSGGGTPTLDSNHGDTDMRLGTTSQSIQSVVSVKDGHYIVKRRCRDFDEKGYCMRGELCPHDHGIDPVVLEDVSLPPNLAFTQSNPSALPSSVLPGLESQTMPASVNPTTGIRMPGPPLLPIVHHPPAQPTANMEYNPDAPSMEPSRSSWIRHQFRPHVRGSLPGPLRGIGPGQLPMGLHPFNVQHQRELIPVPVADGYGSISPNKRPHSTNFSTDMELPLKQRQFDYSRLGPRRGMISKQSSNCSLELKKIPPGLNSIMHLNDHFAKFGKIVNIQVCFEGDREAALITFSSHAEASSAYKSTEAVLNNRFIKVFWHNTEKEGKQENVPPHKSFAKERLSFPPHQEIKSQQTTSATGLAKVVLEGKNIIKTVYIPTTLQSANEGSILENNRTFENPQYQAANALSIQEVMEVKDVIRKKHEDKQKEAQQLTFELCKRKQDLLDSLLDEQKALVNRLEKRNLTSEQREDAIKTIKSLQDNIDGLREDIKKAVAMKIHVKGGSKLVSQQLLKKTKEEVSYLF